MQWQCLTAAWFALVCDSVAEIKSREERNSQFFAEDQSLLDNVSTDSWLAESNEAAADYWPRNERRQESVLLQLEESEDRTKLALEREEQIGNIVQSIADLKHIFKVRYIQVLFCVMQWTIYW